MDVKFHSGYNACHICRIPGKYVDGKVCFPFDRFFDRRCDDSYKVMDENNQSRLSPLTEVSNFVTQFPPEYMHCVLLGSFKRLLSFFVSSKKGRRFDCKLSAAKIADLNARLMEIKPFVPAEFQRKVRSFDYFDFYKATELRQLPLIFKNVLR